MNITGCTTPAGQHKGSPCERCGYVALNESTETEVDYEGHGLNSSGFSPLNESTRSTAGNETVRETTESLVYGVISPDGGATEWVVEPKTSGYLVGIPRYSVTPSLPINLDVMDTWVFVTGHMRDVSTLGSWRNDETAEYVFDACDWHEHYALALTEANARGEIAIWDIAGNREVNTIEGLDNLHK